MYMRLTHLYIILFLVQIKQEMNMKKLVLGTVAAALLATSGLAAEFTIKFSHEVSPNTPKGKAADLKKD